MKKLLASLSVAALVMLSSIPAFAQVPPGLLRFGTAGDFAPLVGDCLSIMAMNSSGQTATDSGTPCFSVGLTAAYTNATTAYTPIISMLAVPGDVGNTGICFLTWESSSTSGTPTFAVGLSAAPTDLWVTAVPSDGTYVAPTFTTITGTTTTAVTGALVTTAANTAYQVRLTFTIAAATAADTLTVYANTNNASYTTTVEPGSYCAWIP